MTAGRESHLLVRGAFRLVARTLFRVQVLGLENIPTGGPALLVSNHLTYLDAFLIGSCFRRIVRFLVWKPFYESLIFGWGLRMAGTIPVEESPHAASNAIALARAGLEQGHLLCVFAEGSISRTGELMPFKRGLEAIANGLDVPIIPVCLGGLWASVFSYAGGRCFWKRPRYFRHPVVVAFGPALPPSSKAFEVRRAVQILRAPGKNALQLNKTQYPPPYGPKAGST